MIIQHQPLLRLCTPKGDVYGFAIIMQEILSRDRPYYADDLSPGGKVKIYNCNDNRRQTLSCA